MEDNFSIKNKIAKYITAKSKDEAVLVYLNDFQGKPFYLSPEKAQTKLKEILDSENASGISIATIEVKNHNYSGYYASNFITHEYAVILLLKKS